MKESIKLRIADATAQINSIRDSHIPKSDQRFLIKKLNQVIKADKKLIELEKQFVEVLEK